MAATETPLLQDIGSSAELTETSPLIFELTLDDGYTLPCFAVRKLGVIHAYVNRCMHWPVTLDMETGDFWDYDEKYLQCKTHGALYQVEDGLCIAGPCTGDRLVKLAVHEEASRVYLNRSKLPPWIDEV